MSVRLPCGHRGLSNVACQACRKVWKATVPQSAEDLVTIEPDAFWNIMAHHVDENDIVHLEDVILDYDTWYKEKCDAVRSERGQRTFSAGSS